jgi:hypothetical protein
MGFLGSGGGYPSQRNSLSPFLSFGLAFSGFFWFLSTGGLGGYSPITWYSLILSLWFLFSHILGGYS